MSTEKIRDVEYKLLVGEKKGRAEIGISANIYGTILVDNVADLDDISKEFEKLRDKWIMDNIQISGISDIQLNKTDIEIWCRDCVRDLKNCEC